MRITLRPLDEHGAEIVAHWFDDDPEGMRRFGGFYGQHPRWWHLVETDPHRVGFIATQTRDLGFVDLEQVARRVNVSIYIRADHRGEGLGTELLRMAVTQASALPGAEYVIAEIEPDNLASVTCCRRCDFVEVGRNEHGDLVLRYDLR